MPEEDRRCSSIQNSKFIDDAGPGIKIAGSAAPSPRSRLHPLRPGNRPIPRRECAGCASSAICDNQQVTADGAAGRPLHLRRRGRCRRPPERLRGGRDMRFEVNRSARKKKVSLVRVSRRAARRRPLARSSPPCRARRARIDQLGEIVIRAVQAAQRAFARNARSRAPTTGARARSLRGREPCAQPPRSRRAGSRRNGGRATSTRQALPRSRRGRACGRAARRSLLGALPR